MLPPAWKVELRNILYLSLLGNLSYEFKTKKTSTILPVPRVQLEYGEQAGRWSLALGICWEDFHQCHYQICKSNSLERLTLITASFIIDRPNIFLGLIDIYLWLIYWVPTWRIPHHLIFFMSTPYVSLSGACEKPPS